MFRTRTQAPSHRVGRRGALGARSQPAVGGLRHMACFDTRHHGTNGSEHHAASASMKPSACCHRRPLDARVLTERDGAYRRHVPATGSTTGRMNFGRAVLVLSDPEARTIGG
jgi:hypothetical protein